MHASLSHVLHRIIRGSKGIARYAGYTLSILLCTILVSALASFILWSFATFLPRIFTIVTLSLTVACIVIVGIRKMRLKACIVTILKGLLGIFTITCLIVGIFLLAQGSILAGSLIILSMLAVTAYILGKSRV